MVRGGYGMLMKPPRRWLQHMAAQPAPVRTQPSSQLSACQRLYRTEQTGCTKQGCCASGRTSSRRTWPQSLQVPQMCGTNGTVCATILQGRYHTVGITHHCTLLASDWSARRSMTSGRFRTIRAAQSRQATDRGSTSACLGIARCSPIRCAKAGELDLIAQKNTLIPHAPSRRRHATRHC